MIINKIIFVIHTYRLTKVFFHSLYVIYFIYKFITKPRPNRVLLSKIEIQIVPNLFIYLKTIQKLI